MTPVEAGRQNLMSELGKMDFGKDIDLIKLIKDTQFELSE
jgi:hypothetical protein